MLVWQQRALETPDSIALLVPKQDKIGLLARLGLELTDWQKYYQKEGSLQDNALHWCISWYQLSILINQRAKQLQQAFIAKGDGVALVGKSGADLLISYLAVLQCGGRVLCINPAFPEVKVTQICQQTDMAYRLDCDDTHALFAIKPLVTKNKKAVIAEDILSICPLTLTLTSGSSGYPKAVVHKLSAHLASASGVVTLMKGTSLSVWLLSLPLFHVSGQGIVWRWLYTGCRLQIVSENLYQDLFEVTHASLVPTQLQRFLAYLQQKQCDYKLQHILLGGTHIPQDLTEKTTALGVQSYSGYGMTEMASTVFAKPSNQTSGVGYLLAGREAKLVAQEVWVKGACLAEGYWQNSSQPKRSLSYIRPLVNEDGWYQTKDKAAFIEQNGARELFILGRFDNMFISGGENIQPEEIEQIILRHSAVEQVFIVPKVDREFGHRPVAMVSFNQPFDLTLVESLRAYIQDKLEKFKQPIAYFSLEQVVAEIGGVNGIKVARSALINWLEKKINLDNNE